MDYYCTNFDEIAEKKGVAKGGDWVEFVLKYDYTINKVQKTPPCWYAKSAGKETATNAKKKSETSGWTL